MGRKKYAPPKAALWLLRHVWPGDDNEVLAGDLVERFHEGQTYPWLWKQMLMALMSALRAQVHRRWPLFVYAVAGTLLMVFVRDALELQHPERWIHWRVLPWPWSQIGAELSTAAVLAFAALLILSAGLVMQGSFRWVYVIRTAAINLILLGLGHFSTDAFPWLNREVPGYNPYHYRMMIIPFWAQWGLIFCNFLLSAWLACASRGRARTDRSHAVRSAEVD
jgi:hypothetical protein